MTDMKTVDWIYAGICFGAGFSMGSYIIKAAIFAPAIAWLMVQQ
jgi:hypothetical protein